MTRSAIEPTEDLVTGSVSESSNPQSGVQSMPDSVSLNVTVGGQGVHLELQVDQSVDRDVPVFILSSNENGELETRRVTLNKTEDFAIYHDVTQGAAFSARRSVDEDGQSYLSLEGILQVEGKMYDLKSTGRRNQNSSEDTTDRKDSPPENSVTHAPGHNVQRRDVSGEEAAKSGQNEAGEDHEFVVHLRDDLLPGGQRGDAVVAPPTVTRTIEMRDLTGNKLPPPPAAAPPPVRKRRQSSKQNIYIDVVAVVDYRVFSDWYTRSSAANKTQDAIVSISQYYAFVYSGTASASTWTESLRQTASPRDIVNTNQVLAKFSDWVSNPNTTLPSYDHLTLFSGYEFIKVDGTTLIASDAITGLAYLSSLCLTDGKSSSVVEDHGGFRCMFTAAHELGHSLSAEHDGNENACSASDQYIMTSTSSLGWRPTNSTSGASPPAASTTLTPSSATS
ncbi:hypothetical protein C0Q70_04548 [Pomacea canaliculata]|uniref:Peptidase M12B domain-containing protein n=1 Tax=Pomacea canaliculata TaxID=400727 RepID=A0A2T7PIP3_POMCA|nr:hypothetical protein C0Q70_04548 [Pomacea canaliculata]